jgi:hypothetical protein
MPSFASRASRELASARQLSCVYPFYPSCDIKDNCKFSIGLSADQMATAQACGQSMESSGAFNPGMPWPPLVLNSSSSVGQPLAAAAHFGLYPGAGVAFQPAPSPFWAPCQAGPPWGMQPFYSGPPAPPWYQQPQMGGRQGDLRRLIVEAPPPSRPTSLPQYTDADVQRNLEQVAGVLRKSRAVGHYDQVAQWGDRLSTFLGRLPGPSGVTMLTATPVEVCLFMKMEVEPNHGPTGARVKARCLLIHAEASLSLSLAQSWAHETEERRDRARVLNSERRAFLSPLCPGDSRPRGRVLCRAGG